MTDSQFRLMVSGIGVVAALLLTFLRFCGDVSLPAKPPAPAVTTVTSATATDILRESAAKSDVWKTMIEQDAKNAGVPVPSTQAMSRVLPYKVDESRRVLEAGDPPFESAGLVLRVSRRTEDGDVLLALSIENRSSSILAYQVVTRLSGGGQGCGSRNILPYNAMVIAPHGIETRSECTFRAGTKLYIDRVETAEVSELSALYLSKVPPIAIGIDPRLARGHKPLSTSTTMCSQVMPQAVRGDLERGATQWRDLVDYYARHRCDTYQFPKGYKYFSRDNERPLPVVGG
jgi:hypothetical protein